MTRVAFRVDTTAERGWGHLKRCMALGHSLHQAGAELAFCGRASSPAVAEQLRALGWLWVPLAVTIDDATDANGESPEAADAATTLAALPWQADVLVVDHYGLGALWHQAARTASGARIVAIDDLANRALAPDLLVDPNPSEDHREKYRNVLADGVDLCGGPTWTLLDPVYQSRPLVRLTDRVQTLGIFLGGTDPLNHSCWVLELVRRQLQWTGTVHVASTSGNPHLAQLRATAQRLGAELFLDLPHLADFHARCDLQVGAGGGALWERCRLGVPTLALICADNQEQTIPALQRAGVVRGLDVRGRTHAQADALVLALQDLLTDAGQRRALQQRAAAWVDGQGAVRLAQRVLALLPNQPLRFRAATLDDAQTLLDWRNDPQTRQASHSAGVVAAKDHQAWLQRCLADPQRRLWVACQHNQAVGTVRAEPSADGTATLLSWTVNPARRGTGVGRAMVELATQQLAGRLLAEVKEGNMASQRIALAAGLQQVATVDGTWLFERR